MTRWSQRRWVSTSTDLLFARKTLSRDLKKETRQQMLTNVYLSMIRLISLENHQKKYRHEQLEIITATLVYRLLYVILHVDTNSLKTCWMPRAHMFDEFFLISKEILIGKHFTVFCQYKGEVTKKNRNDCLWLLLQLFVSYYNIPRDTIGPFNRLSACIIHIHIQMSFYAWNDWILCAHPSITLYTVTSACRPSK